MSQVNVQGGFLENVFVTQLRLKHETRTVSADVTLTVDSPTLQIIDPGGAGRNVALPSPSSSKGLVFIIHNATDGTAGTEVLTVKDGTTTVVTPDTNEAAVVYCDGSAWKGFVATMG